MTRLEETAACWYLPADVCREIIYGLAMTAADGEWWSRVNSFSCVQVALGCIAFRAEVGGLVDLDGARRNFRHICEMHCRGNENVRLKPPNEYRPMPASDCGARED